MSAVENLSLELASELTALDASRLASEDVKQVQKLVLDHVVVAMAGYNTVCELRESGCRAVLVPRVRPRLEQWIRAQALASRTGTEVLHPDTLSPRLLWDAIESVLASPRPEVEQFHGRRVAAMRAADLVASSPITSDCETRG